MGSLLATAEVYSSYIWHIILEIIIEIKTLFYNQIFPMQIPLSFHNYKFSLTFEHFMTCNFLSFSYFNLAVSAW